jgi:hypothetical protein
MKSRGLFKTDFAASMKATTWVLTFLQHSHTQASLTVIFLEEGMWFSTIFSSSIVEAAAALAPSNTLSSVPVPASFAVASSLNFFVSNNTPFAPWTNELKKLGSPLLASDFGSSAKVTPFPGIFGLGAIDGGVEGEVGPALGGGAIPVLGVDVFSAELEGCLVGIGGGPFFFSPSGVPLDNDAGADADSPLAGAAGVLVSFLIDNH